MDVQYEDNVGRAKPESDRISDAIVTAHATGNWFIQTGMHSSVTLKAIAEYADYRDLDGLDHLNYGLGATYRFKPDLSYTAPWYGIDTKLVRTQYLDSSLRDGTDFLIEGVAGKRLTDRIMVKAGIGFFHHFSDRDAPAGGGLNRPDVFETENVKAFAGFDYRPANWTLYGTYTYQNGDVVSTSLRTSNLDRYSDAWFIDDAIGPAPNGKARWAYRINARTHITDLGVNYPLSRSTALDFLVRYVEVSADGGNDYDNYSAQLGLLYRWQ